MKVVIQFLKFLCYSVLAVAEFLLKMALDIVLQAKKAFQ
jgi:hypothetical protein